MKNPTHFKIDIGSISSDGDIFAPDWKFTFGNILEGEKEVIPTSEQIKHGLQFEILESHEENGIIKIDKLNLLSASVGNWFALFKGNHQISLEYYGGKTKIFTQNTLNHRTKTRLWKI